MKLKHAWFALALLLLTVINPAWAKQERSEKAKDNFKYSHPCPANGNNYGPCPGFTIDHIKSLACGGADDPSNMQWQGKAEAKAKDKWERKGCSKGRRSSTPPSTGQYKKGSRGGCFTYSASGKKRYVDHAFCQ